MKHEIWKPVNGYEGLYEVSNSGKVRSLRFRNIEGRAGILREITLPSGYKYVNLHKDGVAKHHYLHRLVATAFIPNPNGLPEVNHRNENPGDNTLNNLEWCSSQYNKNYGNRAIKMAETKKDRFTGENAVRRSPVVCEETGVIYPTMRKAAQAVGVTYTKISLCCTGKRKTAGGYHWKYAKTVGDNTCQN